MRAIALFAVFLSLPPLASARAWWDEGHMQIAFVAYQHLDDAVKDRADALLRLNSNYTKWTASAPDEATAKLYAFVHAATWADDIKMKQYGYIRDTSNSSTAGQNIGYVDQNQHAYWHFKDINFSPDNTTLPLSDQVDAVTQLRLMAAALRPTSGANDNIRSYDLVWTIHLVGDLHQPMHAASRYTQGIPGGDAGGNVERVIPATGEILSLHAYWDRIFGGYSSPFGAVLDASATGGLAEMVPDQNAARNIDPATWAGESEALARRYAYAAPIGTDATPVMLTRTYETEARNVARSQAALAAARLANFLNDALR